MDATIVRRRLLVATAALFAVRAALALLRTGPLVVADEVGYLTNARVLVGGQPGQMTLAPFYRGGYSLLIAPVVATVTDPEDAYRLVLVVNALLAASVVPLLYLFLRRLRIDAKPAMWAAVAAAAYPTVTTYSQVALAENLLLPLLLVWLIALVEALRARTWRAQASWCALVGAVAAALFAVHGRMVVVAAVTVAAVAVAVAARMLAIPCAAVAVTVLAVGLLGAARLDSFLVSANYGGIRTDEVGPRLAGLGTVDGVLSIARNLVGQTWYLMVAPLGLVTALAAANPRGVWREIRERSAVVDTFAVGSLASTAVGLLALSALSFPTLERPDMLVYGRYVDVVVPPFIALALALPHRLALGAPRAAVAVGLATAVVVVLRLSVHPPGAANRFNVAALPFLTFDLGPWIVAAAGGVAAASILSLGAVHGRFAWAVAPLALILFLPTTAVVERNPVLSSERGVYGNGWTAPTRAAARLRTVGFDTDHHDGLYVYQWFLPHARLVLFSGLAGRPPTRYVLSTESWALAHRRLEPQLLWRDSSPDHRGHALFRLRAELA